MRLKFAPADKRKGGVFILKCREMSEVRHEGQKHVQIFHKHVEVANKAGS